MNRQQRGRIVGPADAECRVRGATPCFFSIIRLGLILLIPVLAATLSAQTIYSGTGDSTSSTTSNSSNCIDSLGSSSQCGTQSTGESNRLLLQQTGAGNQGLSGIRNGNAVGNYNDTEVFSSRAKGNNQSVMQPLAPQPLTDFQKFVASTTGQVLPIFGASLFNNVPSTFAPLNLTPVPSDYVIGPGDELRIRIWGQVNFQANLSVDRSGEIYLPQVGPVQVAGIPYSDLAAHLRSAIGRVYRNFNLTVDVGQIRSIQVYVTGEARRPGVYTVSSLSTLVDALFASGGPSIHGSMRDVQLRRGNKTVTHFDLYRLLIDGDKSGDVQLQSGDVIYIPPVGPQAAVTGSVRNPAIYELRKNESLAGLLASAGGVSAVASDARVSIERIDAHHDRYAMEVKYDKAGLATVMDDGDLVRVYSIEPAYRKTVTLRGNTLNPGRYAWHKGMRISDLIPNKESLLTRNYWWQRAQLGLPAPEYEPVPGFSNFNQPPGNRAITLNTQQQLGTPLSQQQYGTVNPGQSSGNESLAELQTNPSEQQASSWQTMPSTQSTQSTQPTQPTSSTQKLSSSQTISSGQTTSASQAQPFAQMSSSAQTQTFPGAQLTTIRQLAPDIDWNYAVIQRIDPKTLKTVLIPFDLGKLVLHHDPSQNLKLEPGDIVTIFSQADLSVPIAQQTKIVRLEGEFVHSGIYTVKPGETLRQLVKRAGGLTKDAYLYGSEFTRESTRRLQQARIDEYVRTLDMQIDRSNLALAASSIKSTDQTTASAQSIEQELLGKLQQMRATGRIVLQLKPGSTGVNSLPKITLENGDSFIVPPVPATVNVVGAVYNQNSFLYAQGKRVADYMRLAGGASRDADSRHEFIIRANGEVISRNMDHGFWGGGFKNIRMYPGDTIVVPDKTYRPTALRTVLNWSQVFSQLALGAASISILR